MTSKERNSKVTHAGAIIFRGSGEGAEVLLTKMVEGRVPGFF